MKMNEVDLEFLKTKFTIFVVLELLTWLGRRAEEEKGHNATSASVEEVEVKVEAELGNLNNFGLVNV